MPRDQEKTSFDQTPSTSRHSFGARATGADDTAAADDTTAADREAARADDQDSGAFGRRDHATGAHALTAEDRATGTDDPSADAASYTDAGMDAAGKDARGADTTARDRGFAEAPRAGESSTPPPEGEWVAGARGPSVTGTRSTTDTTPLTAGTTSTAETTPATDRDSVPDTAGTTPGTDTARLDEPAAGAHAAPTAAAPGSAGNGAGFDVAGAAFITDADGYRASWVRIQSGFVDDPHGAVTEAADLIAQITGALVSAVQERERSLRGGWDSGNADTENLRVALRDYRTFFERLMKV